MADVQLRASGTQSAPLDYPVPGAQEILVKGLRASFDGTGAAGSFVPTVQLIAPGGGFAIDCPAGSTLAAGASADLTWFPGVGVSSGTGTGSGIQFDTDNEGGWLDITTNNTDTNGFGFDLEDKSGGGIRVESTNGAVNIGSANAGVGISSGNGTNITDGSAAGVLVTETGAGGIFVNNQGNGGTTIEDDGTGGMFINTSTANGSTLELLGTAASDANPRLQIFNTASGTGDTMFVGNDKSQIKWLHGAEGSHIAILGGTVSNSTTLTENVYISGFRSDAGTATNYKNCTVSIDGVGLMIHTTDTEPNGTVVGTDTQALVLYVLNDGSGHPKLKVWCGANSTRATLATL